MHSSYLMLIYFKYRKNQILKRIPSNISNASTIDLNRH